MPPAELFCAHNSLSSTTNVPESQQQAEHQQYTSTAVATSFYQLSLILHHFMPHSPTNAHRRRKKICTFIIWMYRRKMFSCRFLLKMQTAVVSVNDCRADSPWLRRPPSVWWRHRSFRHYIANVIVIRHFSARCTCCAGLWISAGTHALGWAVKLLSTPSTAAVFL